MSYINRISLYNVIGNFVGNTGINNVNDMIDDLARWATEAEMKIGSKHSYEKHECEIDVENYRACLPNNFAYLIALNVKGEILDITQKEFTMFDKAGGTQQQRAIETRNLNSNQLVTTTPGVAQSEQITLVGVFNDTDVVNLTITSSNNGKINTNVFSHTVTLGESNADIVNSLTNSINAINLSYSAIPNGDSLQVNGNSPEIALTIQTYTSSATGTLSQTTLVARVAPTSSTNTSGTQNATPLKVSENLSSREAAELNTGLSATSRGGQFFGGYHGFSYPYSPNSSKFSIENGYIYFTQVEEGKVGIAYMGIMVDEQGWPMIAEDHADAVSAYLTYMYIKKRFIMGKVGGNVYQAMKQEWEWKCGEARGDDELPNEAELRYLTNMWMQLVPLPNKTFF